MAEDVLSIPGDLDLDQKRAVAEHRRCILLALLACTSPSNPTLKKLLSDGLLVTVKSWLDDILNGAIGASLRFSALTYLFILFRLMFRRRRLSLSRFQEALICCFISYQVLLIFQ